MKPISLRITGLHSFREPQTVDFAGLCEAGLFGIFGPTGSGKSTVLDAVTLALFGKVERAARGTQGIINHAAERVAVELVFELALGEQRRRYRVERVYKRSGDNTAALQAARLVEITGAGEVPVAEKRAVDGAVEELLGLKVEDFTRAVVLPQGKFDEFLKKVRPADRRAMLERLFGLEEYGDRLKRKLDREFEAVERTLAVCESELTGLGDASDEALQRAAVAFQTAVRLAGEAATRYQVLEKQQGEMAQVWSLQEELTVVRLAMAGLAQQGPAMQRISESLAASLRASRVMPLVLEAEQAGVTHREAQESSQGLRERLPETTARATRADEAWRAAHEGRSREEPQLQAQKNQLERAVRLEEEVAALQADQGTLQEELDRLAGEKKVAEAQGEKLGREKGALEGEMAVCLDGLNQAQVDQEWRQRVQEALASLENWQRAQQDHGKARDDLAAKDKLAAAAGQALMAAEAAEMEQSQRLVQAGQEERSVRERRPEEEDSLAVAAVEVERLRSRLGEMKDLDASLEQAAAGLAARRVEAATLELKARQAAEFLVAMLGKQEDAAARVQELDDRLADLRVRNQAYFLAQNLREDSPCPVCGSRHHPDPAVTDEAAHLEQAAAQLAAAQDTASGIREELDRARSGEAAARAGSEALARAAGEAVARLDDLKARMEDRRAGLPAAWAGLSTVGMERELATMEEGLIGRREALANWRQAMEKAQAVLEEARAAAAETAVKKAGAESDRRAKGAAAQEAADRAGLAGAELARGRVHLDTVRGDIATENISEEQRLVEQRDVRRLDMEKRRETLEAGRQGVAAALDKQGARANELNVQISIRTERLTQVSRQGRDKQQELAGITGGRVAGEFLAETANRLQEVSALETAAGEAAKESAAAQELLARELAVADSSFNLAAERLAKSLARMQAALDGEGFVSGNEAREMLLPAVEQEEGEKTLAGYQSAKDRETNRARDLQVKLAGRELSAAEWQACRDGVAEAGEARNRALEGKGARGKEYEKIQHNNVRWKELRGTASQAAARKGKLELLRGLFRGNAFVDFLAEEQLVSMAADASHRLGRLTNYRYALEVDSEGNFIIRDDANGGVRRPVSSLSGGETFVASLALALALSLQIQLKGHYPLEFFFLDEGFGTLDPDLLEVVVSTLESLHLEHLNIGIISHVPELRNRFPRQLVVCPAEASGTGSRLVLESN